MENKMNINGMDYVLVGDYYIPDLRLPNEERPMIKRHVWCIGLEIVFINLCVNGYRNDNYSRARNLGL